MNRNTLARHRLTGGHRFARTSAEGGGGGGSNTGGSDTGGGSTGGTDPGAGGGGSDAGVPRPTDTADPNYFPPGTSVAEMTPQHQAAYHRYQSKVSQAHQRELERELAVLRPKATEYDELIASTRSEAEVAIDEALEQGRAEGRSEVQAEAATEFLRGQLSVGRTDDAVATLMRGINAGGFVGQDGKIDYTGLRAFAATLGGGTQQQDSDIGNGRRGGTGKPSVAGGRSLFQDRHAKPAAASSSTAG